MAAPYFVLVREMRDAYNHRLRLVDSARQRGIKPTARLFQTTGLLRKRRGKYQRKQEVTAIGEGFPIKELVFDEAMHGLDVALVGMGGGQSLHLPALLQPRPPQLAQTKPQPWQIIERLAPRSPLHLCLLPPVFLDYYLNDSGGYDLA